MSLSNSAIDVLDGQAESTPELMATPTVPGPKLTSLIPVLQELGDSLICEDGKYYILSDLEPCQWAQLQIYAANVEELQLSSVDTKIANDTYIQLARLQGRNPLFSNLKQLHIEFHTTQGSSFDILLALSHSLGGIKLVNPNLESQLQLSRSLVQHPYALLSYICIQNTALTTRLLAAILNTCQLLDTLELRGISGNLHYEHLQGLLGLPFLQNFTFVSSTDYIYVCEPEDTAKDPVQGQLRQHQLSLELDSTVQVNADILSAVGSHRCNLKILDISIQSSWKNPMIDEIANIFRVCPQEVQVLFMKGLDGVDLSKGSILSEIASLHNLIKIHFPPMSCLADDSDPNIGLTTCLSSLSRLKEVVLPCGMLYGSYPHSNRWAGVSLSCFKAIAQACPNLRTLRTLVNPAASFEPPGGLQDCLLGHHLRELTFVEPENFRKPKNQSYEFTFTVAHYLYALFPHLEKMDHVAHPLTSNGQVTTYWKPVADIHLILKNACDETKSQRLAVAATSTD